MHSYIVHKTQLRFIFGLLKFDQEKKKCPKVINSGGFYAPEIAWFCNPQSFVTHRTKLNLNEDFSSMRNPCFLRLLLARAIIVDYYDLEFIVATHIFQLIQEF